MYSNEGNISETTAAQNVKPQQCTRATEHKNQITQQSIYNTTTTTTKTNKYTYREYTKKKDHRTFNAERSVKMIANKQISTHTHTKQRRNNRRHIERSTLTMREITQTRAAIRVVSFCCCCCCFCNKFIFILR